MIAREVKCILTVIGGLYRKNTNVDVSVGSDRVIVKERASEYDSRAVKEWNEY
jgi:hypothetical protein